MREIAREAELRAQAAPVDPWAAHRPDRQARKLATARLELPEGDPIAIDVAPATVDVPAGESVDITVEFNCMATDDIAIVMDLSLEVSGRVGVFEIPLTLDVV